MDSKIAGVVGGLPKKCVSAAFFGLFSLTLVVKMNYM